MPQSVAVARRHLEQKFKAVANATFETMKAYIEQKEKEIIVELEKTVTLQQELQAFDLSQYDTVERFEFTWLYNNAAACTVKIGEQPTPANVTMQPGATYRCYLLMRRVTEEKTA